MQRICDRMGNVLLAMGLMLIVASVWLVPTSQVLASDPSEPAAICGGDAVCDAGTPEKCFYNLNLSRCSQNGDYDPSIPGTITDTCTTSDQQNCKDCQCKRYRPSDGAPWSCRCE